MNTDPVWRIGELSCTLTPHYNFEIEDANHMERFLEEIQVCLHQFQIIHLKVLLGVEIEKKEMWGFLRSYMIPHHEKLGLSQGTVDTMRYFDTKYA